MDQKNTICLKTSNILNIPLQTYEKDFVFIVNDEQFQTSRLISNLLSPVICQMHTNDPTIDTFTIRTQQKGDFSKILNLVNFDLQTFTDIELDYALEIFEILGIDSVEYTDQLKTTNLSIDDALKHLQIQEAYSQFYCNLLQREIDFIASHFFELCESRYEEFADIPVECILKIVNNDHFQLNYEDQLLNFINKLYAIDTKFSILYETVLFENVSTESICDFISIFDISDMSTPIWNLICKRLEQKIERSIEKSEEVENELQPQKRYRSTYFKYSEDNIFKGIFNYIQSETGNKIENLVDFTSSNDDDSDEDLYPPQNVALFENKNAFFFLCNSNENWICFDFKDHRVSPSHYTIRSIYWCKNCNHPKSWVIEASDDKKSWIVIDEQSNCSYLNGQNLVHTFTVNSHNPKLFRYIRMRSTGKDWSNGNSLGLESFEIYGKFI